VAGPSGRSAGGSAVAQSTTVRLTTTRRTDLALRALGALASTSGTDGRTKARDLAERIGSTPGFTTQALTPLVRVGWVSAAPGPTGGYALEDAGRRASVLELVELLEGPVVDGRCVLEGGSCHAPDPCALHLAWTAARESLRTALAAVPAVASDSPTTDSPTTDSQYADRT
jgi:Rrf2 family protein